MSERQKTVPQARGRRFRHVLEVAHTVYKCALNRLLFRAQPQNYVIASVSVAISWKRNDKFFLRPCRNYSLLIIHYSLFFSKAEIARGDEKTGDKGE